MTLRQTLKRSDAIAGLVRDLKRVGTMVRNGMHRERRIRRYLDAHATTKLQIGTGYTVLPDWLSTDLEPAGDHVVQLDATRRFPFADRVFDYVYSEHMIEHISWPAGRFMLGECRRVLKPGGTIRIATPDLAVLLGLYSGSTDPMAERYVRWITDSFLPGVNVYKPAFVVNNAFGNWGHQFLYDGETLAMALREAGFVDIRRCAPGESGDPVLRGIESHGRNVDNEAMNRFETMVFEADAPGT